MTRPYEQRAADNDAHVVSFYDRHLKARLSSGTLSAGQAAKRDLARYHALIDDALPTIRPQDAGHLMLIMQGRTQDPPDHWPMIETYTDTEYLALLDAADRCAAEHDTQGGYLPDLLRKHFRLIEEGEG